MYRKGIFIKEHELFYNLYISGEKRMIVKYDYSLGPKSSNIEVKKGNSHKDAKCR